MMLLHTVLGGNWACNCSLMSFRCTQTVTVHRPIRRLSTPSIKWALMLTPTHCYRQGCLGCAFELRSFFLPQHMEFMQGRKLHILLPHLCKHLNGIKWPINDNLSSSFTASQMLLKYLYQPTQFCDATRENCADCIYTAHDTFKIHYSNAFFCIMHVT